MKLFDVVGWCVVLGGCGIGLIFIGAMITDVTILYPMYTRFCNDVGYEHWEFTEDTQYIECISFGIHEPITQTYNVDYINQKVGDVDE